MVCISGAVFLYGALLAQRAVRVDCAAIDGDTHDHGSRGPDPRCARRRSGQPGARGVRVPPTPSRSTPPARRRERRRSWREPVVTDRLNGLANVQLPVPTGPRERRGRIVRRPHEGAELHQDLVPPHPVVRFPDRLGVRQVDTGLAPDVGQGLPPLLVEAQCARCALARSSWLVGNLSWKPVWSSTGSGVGRAGDDDRRVTSNADRRRAPGTHRPRDPTVSQALHRPRPLLAPREHFTHP